MRDDQDRAAARRLGDDCRGDHRLAGAGRRDEQHAATPGGDFGRDPVDDVGLIRPQFWSCM